MWIGGTINMNLNKAALDILEKSFADDPEYAYSWHCNIAMACYDAIGDSLSHEEAHKISNEAATRFMKLAFNTETKYR